MLFKINYAVLKENESYFGLFQNYLCVLKKKGRMGCVA